MNKNIVLQTADGGANTNKKNVTKPGGTGIKTGGTKATGNNTKGQTGGTGIDLASLYNAQLSARNALNDEIYGNNMNRIAGAYDSVAGNLASNYDSTVGRLQAARNQSLKDVNLDAENALRQAYINNELTKRNLNQRLSAMGYNGGATETTMANLANEYSKSRGGINTTRNKNIADLNKTYADNLAAALQAYNSAMNQLEMQRLQMENAAENARMNNSSTDISISGLLGGDNGAYIQALQNALASQKGYQYDNAAATNDYTPGSVQQAQSIADVPNYEKALAAAQLAAQNGQDINTIKTSTLFPLMQSGQLDVTSLAQILNALSK